MTFSLAWAVTPAFFYAGVGLVSIPLIIHFLNRRRFKTIQWAAMEYLLAALRKNRRRLRFEQILLLLTRCALLALLGMALARPLGCADSTLATLAGGRSGLHVFVIDNSYSMAYEADRPNARTHLDQAKALAKEQIKRLTPGTESIIILTAAGPHTPDDPKSAPIAPATYDQEAALVAVDRIEQSYGGTDLAGALGRAAALAREDARQATKFLYVLTDFTRSAWEGSQAEALRAGGKDLADVFGPRIRLSNLGVEGQWNYAVLDVRADSNLVTNAFPVDFFADVKGFGGSAETVMQWQWDDKLIDTSMRLKPDMATPPQRQTKAQTKDGGVHLITAALRNDEKLKVDNTRSRVLEVASELKVLIVEGERGANLLSGSGAFLDLALAPRKEIENGQVRSDTYVVPELISDLELSNKVFGDYRAIILTNVASLSAGQAEQLQRFVKQGGTLLIFMGEQVNADAYNAMLLQRQLMPGKLVARKVATDGKGYALDFNPNGQVHPLLSVFKGAEKSGLETARILTYYQTELLPDSKAEVVLKYVAEEGSPADPAITVHRIDEGRVVLFTTTANPDWNTLPAKPAYTPLMHELLAGTVDIGDKWMNLLVGDAVEVPAGLKLSSAPVLSDPNKRPMAMDAAPGKDGQFVYRSKPIEKPGVYSVSAGGKTYPVAVNVPAEEADVRLLAADSIRKGLGDIEVQIFGDSYPAEALVREDSNDLGWMVMLMVAGLAAAECFMAMRFGHYRREPLVKAAL
jgi:hypothetical protein